MRTEAGDAEAATQVQATIGRERARLYLHELGFKNVSRKKAPFFDGARRTVRHFAHSASRLSQDTSEPTWFALARSTWPG